MVSKSGFNSIIISVVVLTIFAGPIDASPSCLNMIGISGGEDHSLVLAADKTVWACGDNEFGQLGNNDQYFDKDLLVQVHGKNNIGFLQNINDIASGWQHSLALNSSGSIWAWGTNEDGQLWHRR